MRYLSAPCFILSLMLSCSAGSSVFLVFPFSALFLLYLCRMARIGADSKNGSRGWWTRLKEWAPQVNGRVFQALLPKRWTSISPLHLKPTCASRIFASTSFPGSWISQFPPIGVAVRRRRHRRPMTNRRHGGGFLDEWARESGIRTGLIRIWWAPLVSSPPNFFV